MGKNKKKSKSQTAVAAADDDFDYTPFEEKVRDEGVWETVVDTKKSRYNERKNRKEEERRAELQRQGITVPKAKDDKKENGDSAKAPSAMKSAPIPKKKSSSKKPPAFKKPSTEKELTELVESILKGAPTRYVQTSVIGNRVQQLINMSWNKAFKKSFGTMPDFLTKNPRFHFDAAKNEVYLSEAFKEFNEINRVAEIVRKEEAENKKKSKKSKKKDSSSTTSKKESKKGSGDDGDSSSASRGCSLLGLASVGILLSIAAGMTYVVVQGGDIDTVRAAVEKYIEQFK